MGDGFLKNYLVAYVEREVAEQFDNDSIIEVLYKMKKYRAQNIVYMYMSILLLKNYVYEAKYLNNFPVYIIVLRFKFSPSKLFFWFRL